MLEKRELDSVPDFIIILTEPSWTKREKKIEIKPLSEQALKYHIIYLNFQHLLYA